MLKNIRVNPIRLTDAYNLSHPRLKVNTDWEISHMYNRSGKYGGMVLYGFSEIVESIMSIVITEDMVKEAENDAKKMNLVFPTDLWMKVVNEQNGKLPLAVQAVPEGEWVPNGTPFAQINNTEEGYGELVTWFEGVLMMAYFPSACATEAYKMRKYLEETKERFGYDGSFMLRFHSFGFRGHRSLEDAYWAGTAWNLFLHGTDDFHTMHHTPNAPITSISALAHKVTQQFDDEYECFKHAIRETAKVGEKIVALVIDTYDADRVINEYALPLANYAASLDVNLVLRPDSGDTWDQTVRIYKIARKNQLKNVSVIIGEGMSLEEAKNCDSYLLANGVPLNFVSYGIGAGFYKHIDRDTHGWAMKTAYSNGADRMKFSMTPLKRSIPGKVEVIRPNNGYMTVIAQEEYVDESTSEYMYDIVYLKNADMEDAFIQVADWDETFERAKHIDDSQTRILLSEVIHDKVAAFEVKYKYKK